MLSEDLRPLLGAWFDVGFLDLVRIDWRASAALLEKLVAYEAVHPGFAHGLVHQDVNRARIHLHGRAVGRGDPGPGRRSELHRSAWYCWCR